MSVSLTRILANAGIPIAMNALVPGSGMADMFVRNAGTGIARGLVNSPSGPQRVGGRGDPAGAMPTRKFGSTRETVGELKSGFKDWLVDPLQAKKEKREQARDTALAVRLGITGGEYSLTHRSAMSLIKKRTGDVQTNIMILQFRVQQFMARNLSAIASTLGVSKSKIGHEEPDPNRSWFGSLLSSIHKDLQENKVFSTLESVGKHIVNIGSILNPFTLGSRAKKGVKTFGEFMQRLAMGKEGFEMMKDPEKIYEKAGLKQDFQTKSLNLMKINNEYQKHQLNMLYNILGATKEMLGIFGGSYQNQKLDLTHDEFSGTLKTHREKLQEEGMRYMRLETAAQAASRRSIVGRFGSLIGGIRNIGYNIAEIAKPSKATRRDLYVLDYLFNMPGFFDSKVRGASDDLDAFIDMYRGRNIDWYDKDNAQLADQFKFFIERAIEHPKPGYEKQAHQLEESWNLIRRQSRVQVSLASTYNTAARVNNAFRNWTGHSAANTDPLRGPRELARQYDTYTRFGGDRNMAGISVGSGGERAVNEYHNTGILPAVLRSIPIIGALFGARQQMEISGLQTRYDTEMRGAYQGPNEDQIFGYGQGSPTGSRSQPKTFAYVLEDFKDKAIQTLESAALPFTLRKIGLDAEIQLHDFFDGFLTDLTGTSQKVSLIEALDEAKTPITLHKIGLEAEIQLHDFFDGFLDNLIERRQKVSIYNITKDACDKLESLEFNTTLKGIGSGAITSLTSEVYDVNLVGIDDQKLLPKITPIIDDFVAKLGVAGSLLIDNNFKNVLVGPGGLVQTIFDKFEYWATDNDPKTSVPTIPGDDTAKNQHQDAISILDAVKNQHNDAISLINAVSGLGLDIRSLGSSLSSQNTSSASLTKENIKEIIEETKTTPLQIEFGNDHVQSLVQSFSTETANAPISVKGELSSAAAAGGVFSGGNISDYSNQIVSQPTLFRYNKLHQFAKGGALTGEMGEGDKPEGIFPLKRDSNGDLGISAPSVIHALLVDIEGKPLPISLPLTQQKQEEKKDDFAPLKSGLEKQKHQLYSGGSVASILRDFSLEKEIKPLFSSAFSGFTGIVSDIINDEIAKKYSSVVSGKDNQPDVSSEKTQSFAIREQNLDSLLSAAQKTSLIGKISNSIDKDNQTVKSNILNLPTIENTPKDKIVDSKSDIGSIFDKTSTIRSLLVDSNGNPVSFGLPASTQKTEEIPIIIDNKDQTKTQSPESNIGSIFDKTSTIRALLVDVNGNPVSFGLPTSQQKTEETKKNVYERSGQDLSIASASSGTVGESIAKPSADIGRSLEKLADAVLSKDKETSEKKIKETTKEFDENDNVKTAAERQKDIEKKQEKKEEEKKEQKQEANEEEKKSLLQRIADYINPESKFNKLREKLRKKKEEGGFSLGSLFGSISGMIPDFMKKLGIGLLGAGLLKLLPDGGKEIIKSIFGFAWDSIKYVGGIVWDLLKEHGPGLAKDAWEAFKEHPLIGVGIITSMFPGTIGTLISKIGIPIIKRFPLATPLVLGFGAMAYNLYEAFGNSKGEDGSFSFGKFVSEFFIGSGDGLGNIIGKAGTYGLIGAKIGAMFGGVGAIPGFIAGAAIGSIIGGTNAKNEKGEFDFGSFLKRFFTGNNAKGGVENARSNALKWGFIGAAIGLPFGGIMAIPGFLAGAGLGAILGGIGSEKLEKAWEKYKTGETVSKYMGWKSDSYAYYMANTPMANIVPFVGPFIWGMCGKLLDLGKSLFDKIKDYLTPDWLKSKEEDPDVKKSQEQANAKRAATFTYQQDTYDPNTGEATKENKTIKITKEQEAYINSGKDDNEKRQRAVEVEQENKKEDNWRRQSAGKTKYDTDKYIELQKKWAKENEERMRLRSYKIDIPATNFGGKEDVFGVINDFNTTKENAAQYNQLIKDNKTDDAIRFAKGIKEQQDEEDNKRKTERDAELKKIEIKDANKKGAGSSPEDLKLDAQRKSSSIPVMMAAKTSERKNEVGNGPDDLKRNDVNNSLLVSNTTPVDIEPQKTTVNEKTLPGGKKSALKKKQLISAILSAKKQDKKTPDQKQHSKLSVGSSPEDLKQDSFKNVSSASTAIVAKTAFDQKPKLSENRDGVGSNPEDLKQDSLKNVSSVSAAISAKKEQNQQADQTAVDSENKEKSTDFKTDLAKKASSNIAVLRAKKRLKKLKSIAKLKTAAGSSPEDIKRDAVVEQPKIDFKTPTIGEDTAQIPEFYNHKPIEAGSNPEDLKMDACRKASCVPAMIAAKMGVGDDDDEPEIVDVRESSSSAPVGQKKEDKKLTFDYGKLNSQFTETEAKYNEATSPTSPKKKEEKKLTFDYGKLNSRFIETESKYNEETSPTAPQKKDDKKLKFDYGKLNTQFMETEAKYNEATTPMGAQKKDDKKLKFDYAKYNQQALAIPAGAEFGLNPLTKENYNPPQATMLGKPTSVPAAAKASEDASKKKDENKGKSGTPSPSVSPAAAPAAPAAAPVETPAPAAPSGEMPTSTPSGSGELNWLEKIISQTIQGAFKVGGFIADVAQKGANETQPVANGGSGAPGDPGGGGAVGSWGGGFSNAEYLPGKPGAASLGTHFITAKPKDPRNRPGRNNNPLNVKISKKGLDKADEGGHRIFGNVDDGIRGNFWQLQRYINGTYQQGRFGQLNTARKIIPVWAPVKDGNNPTAYLQHLQKYGVDIDAPIDLNSPSSLDPLAKLMAGMAREEGWGIINPEEIKKVLTYGNHQGAPGTAQSTGDAAAAPTSAPEAVKKYLSIMARNAQGARYDNDLRNKKGYYDCSSFTARSLADAGIFPRSLVDGKNAPTTSDLPTHLARYGFKFHPYNFRGVKTAPPELQPGDILTANKAQTGGSMGHVVTYWGDNKIIAAHRKNTNPEVGIKPFYTSKQGGYWRYSPGGGSNPDDLFNKTGQTTTENAILPNSAKTPSLFKKLKKTLGSTKLSWPTISSKVNSDYGTRDPSQFAGAKGQISRTHGGVDIQAAEGDPVYSTMSGTVVGTDPNYGTIEVQHPNGWLSKYLHLGKFIARAGEQVKSGQIIGEAGGVGKGGKTDAFNPHLHFELIKDKTKIPPLQMVAAAGINKPTKKEQIDNSNAAGYGGPDFTPRINKQMNEYLENNGVGGPEISVKSDNRVIAELKKLQMLMMGVMKSAGKPSIAVAAPSSSGNEDPQKKATEAGGTDSMTDSMFSQIGGLLPNLNISLTGLGTSIS